MSDQFGCPTYAGDIADSIIDIIRNHTGKKDPHHEIIHYAGNQSTSWAGFARYIFEQAYANGITKTLVQVNDIRTKDYPTAARRPKMTILDCSKIMQIYAIKPSDWKKAVRTILTAT